MCLLHRTRTLLLAILSLCHLTAWAQATPSTNQPVQYATPKGIVTLEQGKTIAGPPSASALKVFVIGVDDYVPPFVMLGGNGELYGYDISMMNSLCRMMRVSCTFKSLQWMDLLAAVKNNQVDLAVSSITITPQRAKEFHFSLPYGLSYSRFLTNVNTPVANPFALSSLDGKKIGIDQGTIYEDQASHLGVHNAIIQIYKDTPEALKALTNNEVDYLLLDNPTALYWVANSSGTFKVIGEPYSYGLGIAIVVSEQDKALIPFLNQALLQYQNSEDFRQNYHRFLESF